MSQRQSEPLAVFNASPTAFAGDVVFLQGSGFGAKPTVQFSYGDSNWVNADLVTICPNVITVRIPAAGQPAFDLLTLRVSADGTNWSAPIYLNRAHGMHFGTKQVTPGGSLRIFGRNLQNARTPTVRLIDQVDGSSHSAVVNTAASTAYALVAKAPADIIPGHTYSVAINNGYNGHLTSGGETVADQVIQCRTAGKDEWNLGVPWAADLSFYKNVYNVKTDSRLAAHAAGNRLSDDAAAIQQAIQTAASAGGGVVYLPAGTYKLGFSQGCSLTLASRVVLAGDGIGKTTLTYGYGPPPRSGGYAVCFPSQASGLVDLSMKNVNKSGKWPQSALAVGGSELFLQRVGWDLAASQWISMTNVDNLAIENSEFTQGVNSNYLGPLELSGASHFLIKNNSISYVAWGLDFGYMRDGVFEQNTVVRDATVALPQSTTTHVIAASFLENFAVLNNKFLVRGLLPLKNDGETLNSEGGGPNRVDEHRGIVTAVDGLTIADTSQNLNSGKNPLKAGNSVIAIVKGVGTGQWRSITKVSKDGHIITVDRPWIVTPEVGSHYATFDWSAANWTIAGNVMTNNEKGIEFFNASSRDVLITGNQMTDNSGIMLSPEQNTLGEFNVVYGVQITHNSIVNRAGLRPAYIAVVPREDWQTDMFGIAVLGIEVRQNRIVASLPNTHVRNSDDEKAVVEALNCYFQWQGRQRAKGPNLPAVIGTIFQGNTIVNSDTALFLNSGAYATAISDMILKNVRSMVQDEVIPGSGHASLGTHIEPRSVLTTYAHPH
jgi:hypothetical protein